MKIKRKLMTGLCLSLLLSAALPVQAAAKTKAPIRKNSDIIETDPMSVSDFMAAYGFDEINGENWFDYLNGYGVYLESSQAFKDAVYAEYKNKGQEMHELAVQAIEILNTCPNETKDSWRGYIELLQTYDINLPAVAENTPEPEAEKPAADADQNASQAAEQESGKTENEENTEESEESIELNSDTSADENADQTADSKPENSEKDKLEDSDDVNSDSAAGSENPDASKDESTDTSDPADENQKDPADLDDSGSRDESDQDAADKEQEDSSNNAGSDSKPDLELENPDEAGDSSNPDQTDQENGKDENDNPSNTDEDDQNSDLILEGEEGTDSNNPENNKPEENDSTDKNPDIDLEGEDQNVNSDQNQNKPAQNENKPNQSTDKPEQKPIVTLEDLKDTKPITKPVTKPDASNKPQSSETGKNETVDADSNNTSAIDDFKETKPIVQASDKNNAANSDNKKKPALTIKDYEAMQETAKKDSLDKVSGNQNSLSLDKTESASSLKKPELSQNTVNRKEEPVDLQLSGLHDEELYGGSTVPKIDFSAPVSNPAADPVSDDLDLPYTGTLSYSTVHGTDRLITVAGLGSWRLLPDYNNQAAWRESASPYNTPRLWGQCTWFAWGRFYEMYGFNPGFSGNGYQCVSQLLNAHPDKFTLSRKPASGAVFSSDLMHNHVGIVLEYDEATNMMTIQEGNLDGISNPIWTQAITDYRTITISPQGLRALYGNVTYAVPKNGTKALTAELKSTSLRKNILKALKSKYSALQKQKEDRAEEMSERILKTAENAQDLEEVILVSEKLNEQNDKTKAALQKKNDKRDAEAADSKSEKADEKSVDLILAVPSVNTISKKADAVVSADSKNKTGQNNAVELDVEEDSETTVIPAAPVLDEALIQSASEISISGIVLE